MYGNNDSNFVGCYMRCDHCQSWPDGYTCSHSKTFVRDLSGKPIQARECFYAYVAHWDKRWLAHPCPFFTGRVSLEYEDGSNCELIIKKEGDLIELNESSN